MTYGHVYVASVAMGAKDEHTLKAFLEAEAYPGPSLIIAYSALHRTRHHMTTAMRNRSSRSIPASGCSIAITRNARQGENPLQLDSPAPKIPLEKYMYMENRFKMLTKSQPEAAKRLLQEAQDDVNARWRLGPVSGSTKGAVLRTER